MISRLCSTLNRLRLNLQSSSHKLCQTRSLSTGRLAKKPKITHSARPNTGGLAKITLSAQPSASVVPELEKWIEKLNKDRLIELQSLLRVLLRRNRYPQALEVSEWMGNNGVCKFTASDHAVQLELIGRVRGLESAESYFNNLDDQDKTEQTYGALLSCYTRACMPDKSLSLMQKMKEIGLPLTTVIYNDIMSLYINIKEYEKVPDVLAEMKENGICPDKLSYSICINSYATRSDSNGVEKVLQEMVDQPHILKSWNTYAMVANSYTKAGLNENAIPYLKKSEEMLGANDGHGYNHLITLYTSLGNKTEVLRLWECKKVICNRFMNADYSTMLASLVKLGELEDAEKLLEEWESTNDMYDFRVPNQLIVGYCQNGLVEKAREMLENIIKKGKIPTPNSWGILAVGYLDKSEMEKALDCIKMAFKQCAGNEGWRPNSKVVTSLLNWLSDEGKVKEVEDFVGLLKAVIPMDREMYHALIRANIRGGKEVGELLKSMKADEIDEDEETKKILCLREVKAE